VEAVRAAGILTVHSAGNKGQAGCSSIDTPAAIYDASFTVGNTTSTDTIAASSSRGPVTVDGSGQIKPDISAPGTSIRSSVKGGGYATLSGTSMAGPHVAGLAALLFSAKPDLIGQVDHIERLITRTAVPVQVIPNDSSCGGIPGTVYPNNFSGWGRIDALVAYTEVIPLYQIHIPLVSVNH
jgi:subtilisin family serine protease